ncbi:hypothetical protein WI666_05265 [Vibrio cholerae]
MIPMINDSGAHLEEGIIASAQEAGHGAAYGLGFLRSVVAGAFRYLDTIGIANYVAMAEKYADLGALYWYRNCYEEHGATRNIFLQRSASQCPVNRFRKGIIK